MRRMFAKFMLAVAITLVIQSGNAGAGVIVDNTSQSQVGNGQIGGGQFEGQEFNTGSLSYTLDSIVAQVGGLSGTINGIGAQLVQDNGGTPAGGTVLTTFTVPSIGSSFVNEEFDPTTSGVVLAANTNYWFILNYSSGSGTFGWNYAGTQSASGPGSLGAYATSFDNGSTWIINNFGPGTPDLIQVNGTVVAAVPETGTLTMAGTAGLFGLAIWCRRRSGNKSKKSSN